jgi:hypothetical protein
MGDFINVNEIEQQKAQKKKTISSHRELLSLLLKSSPAIKAVEACDANGDMRFAINMSELGLQADDFFHFHDELSSRLIIDCLGELLIRENLSIFVPQLTSMSQENYVAAVAKSHHNSFGMHVRKEAMVFSFHISFLQKILTEDFSRV